MNSRYTVIIGILISLIVLALVLAGMDLGRVRDAFLQARYIYVLPAALVLGLSMVTRSTRWRSLLSNRLSLRNAFSILNISYLFNAGLPLRLGEVARIFLANRVEEGVPLFTSLSTIVVERLLDMLVVLGVLGVALALLDVPVYVATGGMALGGMAALGILVLVLLARNPAWAYRLVTLLQRLLPVTSRWDLNGMLARFLDGLAPLAHWRSAVPAVFWSLVSWSMSVIAGYILMFAFYPAANWPAAFLVVALASLAVSVPYAPGAVGPYEAGVVMALTWSGLNNAGETAVAFAVVLHVMTTGVFVVLGTEGLLHQGVSLGQVMRGARSVHVAPANPAPLEQ